MAEWASISDTNCSIFFWAALTVIKVIASLFRTYSQWYKSQNPPLGHNHSDTSYNILLWATITVIQVTTSSSGPQSQWYKLQHPPLGHNHSDTSYNILLWATITVIQCKPDISRLVGSKHWYRDISGSAIYRASVMSHNQAPFSSALWARMGP